MNIAKAKKYLDGVAQDYQSLAEHDKIYHRGGYKEGDACKVREALSKSDDPDKMQRRSGEYEARTKMRNEVRGILEKALGGKVSFDEDDDNPYIEQKDTVGFRIERGAPGSAFEGDWTERKLKDMGYRAAIYQNGASDAPKYNGFIRKYTPEENFERIKSQKPKWNRDYDWNVDGENYNDLDDAMAAWQDAMKKYGGLVKHGSKTV